MGKSDYTFRYRIRNWPEYNRALIARGRWASWYDGDAIGAWRYAEPSVVQGRPKLYADAAIECARVLRIRA